MKRFIVMLVTAGIASTAVYGAAATLGGLTAPNVAADVTQVVACDADGVRISYQIGSGTATLGPVVTSWTVDHIDDDCAGKSLVVRFYNAGGAQFGPFGGGTLPSPLTTGSPDDREFDSGPIFFSPLAVKDIASVAVEISDSVFTTP